jgi:hemin uptake protein HemP
MLDLPPQPIDSAAPSLAGEPCLTGLGTARNERLRITSGRLLAGARELVIEHAGQEYHLRLTRNDKLILTK